MHRFERILIILSTILQKGFKKLFKKSQGNSVNCKEKLDINQNKLNIFHRLNWTKKDYYTNYSERLHCLNQGII